MIGVFDPFTFNVTVDVSGLYAPSCYLFSTSPCSLLLGSLFPVFFALVKFFFVCVYSILCPKFAFYHISFFPLSLLSLEIAILIFNLS